MDLAHRQRIALPDTRKSYRFVDAMAARER